MSFLDTLNNTLNKQCEEKCTAEPFGRATLEGRDTQHTENISRGETHGLGTNQNDDVSLCLKYKISLEQLKNIKDKINKPIEKESPYKLDNKKILNDEDSRLIRFLEKNFR